MGNRRHSSFNLIWNGTCSLLAPGWIAAGTITAINWLIFITYIFSKRDFLAGKIMLLSIIAGFVELTADRWLVAVTGTLVYYTGGPFIVSSPLYMPFAWGVVLTQTAYIGWRILNIFGLVPAVLLTGLLGAVTIPFYEWWANGAMWWYYRECHMLGVVPYYIIAGEFLIASGLVFILYLLERGPWWQVLHFGVAQGLWIWASYVMTYSILG
ncbi:MAG: hypothetical protein MRK02_11480 [Candidatus Scalindua sp.]|nr:hypothetical protein [Candidatus Scalindua sp.]